jgi:hypothetical protein
MWPYWLMFIIFALLAVGGKEHRSNQKTGLRTARFTPRAVFIWLLLVIMIGLRFDVGGDWGNYLQSFSLMRGWPLETVLERSRFEPGYALVSYLSDLAGAGIYGVNLFCAVIFTTGLVIFCRTLPYPELAIAAATPYVIIVVAMGYTRQSVALGFEMLGLVALARRSFVWFIIWIALGVTFHKTAAVLIPLVGLMNARNRIWVVFWGVAFSVAGYFVLMGQGEADFFIRNYVASQMSSSGAWIRVLMNVVPALLLLVWRRRFTFGPGDEKLWFWMAMISLGLVVGLVATPASTAIDRMALYVIPIQMFVFSNLPIVMRDRLGSAQPVILAILCYYMLVQLVWLNFANNAWAWVPYDSVLVATSSRR